MRAIQWQKNTHKKQQPHAQRTGVQAADPKQQAFARIATAIAKYHICKRVPQIAYESMECLGGNGYIEDGIMPTLYRQAPLNAIWEGTYLASAPRFPPFGLFFYHFHTGPHGACVSLGDFSLKFINLPTQKNI